MTRVPGIDRIEIYGNLEIWEDEATLESGHDTIVQNAKYGVCADQQQP